MGMMKGKPGTQEIQKSGPNRGKKKKKIPKGTATWHLKLSMKKSLGSGMQMKDAVKLPDGEDRDQWLAMNTVEIYNNTCLVHGFIIDICDKETCPKMTAGAKYSYLWEQPDGKVIDVPANEYIDLLCNWVLEKLDDERTFPEDGQNYPKNFENVVKKIWKRLARIYYHIYYHHWEWIVELEAEAHLNSAFKHFYYFAQEFSLLSDADLEPVVEIRKKVTLN